MRPLLVLLPIASLALLACGHAGRDGRSAAAPPPDPDWVREGEVLYVRYCASCHGLGARGDGPVAETLATPPADLTRLGERYGRPLPTDRLAAFIDGREAVRVHGPREMPVWGEALYRGTRPDALSPGHPSEAAREAARRGTILLILDYLETLQGSGPTAP